MLQRRRTIEENFQKFPKQETFSSLKILHIIDTIGIISSQLNRIEGKAFTNNYKTQEEKEKTKSEDPLFKPMKPLKLGGNKNNDDLIKLLTQKLNSMEVKDPSSSKDQINFLSGSETGSYVS